MQKEGDRQRLTRMRSVVRRLIILVAVVSGPVLAQAQSIRLTQLTADPDLQTSADIWDRVVVWEQFAFYGDPHNIYVKWLDTGAVIPLTGGSPEPYGNVQPAIYQNLVAWTGTYDNPVTENADICLHDLNTGSTVRLISEQHAQMYPRVWGNYVVWQDYRNMPPPSEPANHDIFGYDLLTGTEFSICTNLADELWPDIWQNLVVYQSNRNDPINHIKYDIYVYDLNTGLETRITTAADSTAWEPRIHNNRVTWFTGTSGGPGGPNTGEVFVQELAGGPRWSSGLADWNEFDPRIWGDRVVWRSGIHWPDPHWSLRTWDLVSGSVRDVGWLGPCSGQEGHNIYQNLTVFCQVDTPPNQPERWDVWLAEELPCLLGDADEDGVLTIADMDAFVPELLDPSGASPYQLCAADMDGDGAIDGDDIQPFVDVLLN